MPQVTKIEPQKKRKARYNVYLDEKFAFGLAEKTLAEAGIGVGDKLNEKEIETILKREQQARALDKALLWLGLRLRSIEEIKKKLKEKKFDQEIISQTIKKLKELNLVDDRKFTAAWIESRKTLKPKGRRMIFWELAQKGVAEELIKSEIEKLYPSEEEFKLAEEIARRKKKTYGRLSREKMYRRLTGFLARRGFDWEMIREVLEKILEKAYNKGAKN